MGQKQRKTKLANHSLVRELLLRVREFAEFMAYHFLRDLYRQVVLAIMHKKLDTTRTISPFPQAQRNVLTRRMLEELCMTGTQF